jgi:cysteine-rich repeat protein
MINCPQCEGFLPAQSSSCPNCDHALDRTARWALLAAKAAAGAATALTLMACYGGGYEPPYDNGQDCLYDYDRDYDGVCAEDDCDDNDPTVGANCDCVDNDQDGTCAENDCDDDLPYECPCVDQDGDEVCVENDCDDLDPDHASFCPNLCSEAAPITEEVTTGTTFGGPDLAMTCGGGVSDAAYAYTVGGNLGELQFITVSLASASEQYLSIRESCDSAEELVCASSAAGGSVELLADPGDILYVVVEATEFAGEGDFELTVIAQPLVCGDMNIVGPEECDDGNTDPGDGCDELCRIEAG